MQAIATAELSSPISHEKIQVVFGGLLLVMLLAALDSTIVATALPTIVKELGGLEHLKPSSHPSTASSVISTGVSEYSSLQSLFSWLVLRCVV